jgi:cold-inducible RNA-binding protein
MLKNIPQPLGNQHFLYEIIGGLFCLDLRSQPFVAEHCGRRLREMNNKLFVGNLSYKVGEEELRELFAAYGEVASCNVAKDRDTGRSRGFAFVEMNSQAEAEAAIKGLNGMDVAGRQLSVSVSQPKPKSSFGGGGGGGGGGGRKRY